MCWSTSSASRALTSFIPTNLTNVIDNLVRNGISNEIIDAFLSNAHRAFGVRHWFSGSHKIKKTWWYDCCQFIFDRKNVIIARINLGETQHTNWSLILSISSAHTHTDMMIINKSTKLQPNEILRFAFSHFIFIYKLNYSVAYAHMIQMYCLLL